MRKNKGFTLVELMIVMAVIAVLATLALVGFRTAQRAARDAERKAVVMGMQVGLECMFGELSRYPGSLDCTDPGAVLNWSVFDCWSGGTPEDPLSGAAGAFADCSGCSCAYAPSASNDAYTITLVGETGQSVFNSPQ